jgi:antitoxin MazE
MVITVKKWGNSLGVRIPKIIARDLNLKDGSTVEIEDSNGTIIISPRKNTLKELLEGINEANIHREIDFGESSGREIW